MGFWSSLLKGSRVNVREGGQAIVSKSGNSYSTILDDKSEDEDTRGTRNKMYKNAYERVPLVRAMIDTKADQTVQDFYFEGPNQTTMEKFSEQVNLPIVLHNIDKTRRIFGDAFVEPVRTKNGKVIELKVIDPTNMRVYRKDTGDVVGYGQVIGERKVVLWGTTGDQTQDQAFPQRIKDLNIIHFKRNVFASEKYGRSDIEPVLQPLQIMLDMQENLRKVVFKYVAPLIWAKVGNDQFPASQTSVDEISNTLRDLSAESEVTTSHLVDLNVLDFSGKGTDLKTPVEHMEANVISGTQVPPVLLGRQGNGTGDAEVQLRNFGRHIKAGQRELKHDFEDKIIKGLGLGGDKDHIQWGTAEEREWEMYVDNLRGLVTDGIITPQKANDLLPPKYNEDLGEDGKVISTARANQMSNDKVTDNPNDPTKTTKNPSTLGKRVNKTDRELPGDRGSAKRGDRK